MCAVLIMCYCGKGRVPGDVAEQQHWVERKCVQKLRFQHPLIELEYARTA